jgi:carbamoyl-phosphate synthase small subunit
MQKVYIYLENGTFLEADSFGANTTAIGKLVYNNATFGQQEIITDPSNSGLFINFTAAEIGNSGANLTDIESSKAQAIGILVRNYHDKYSNYRATMSLAEFLKEQNLLGICNIDTRFLTKILREEGSQMMIASTSISSKDELAKKLNEAKKYDETNFIELSSTKEPYVHKQGIWNPETGEFNKANMSDKKVLVLDFGTNKTFLNNLVESGFEVEVVPHNTNIDEIIEKYNSKKIDAVALSSGAGNPNIYKNEIESIKKLISLDIPLVAVGLGHYLLALASGIKLEKIKAIKSGSHPVKGEKSVNIDSINTEYSIKEFDNIAKSLFTKVFNNQTIALKYNTKNIISSEFTPEFNSSIYKEFTSFIK